MQERYRGDRPNAVVETARHLRASEDRVVEQAFAVACYWMVTNHHLSWAAQRQMMGVPMLGLVSCQMHSQLFRSDLFLLQRKRLLPSNGE